MAIEHSRQFARHGFYEYAQEAAPDKATRIYDDRYIMPTAKTMVQRPVDEYSYHRRNYNDFYSKSPEDPDAGSHSVLGWDGDPRRDKFEASGGQGKLFDVKHRAPKLDLLFAHEDLRPHAMGLLGRAALESHARYGQYPEASDDLSQHSEKIVRRLADKGIIKYPEHLMYPPDENGKIDNGISDDDSFYRQYKEGPHFGQKAETDYGRTNMDLPDWHQNLGSQFIRHALRRPQQGLGAKPQQDHLF